MEIKNQRVLITGANRGIGRAVAKRLAQDGCKLILVMRKADLEIEKEMKEAGASSVEILEADLANRNSIEDFAKKYGNKEVDILFNNAGLLTGGLMEEQPLNEIYDLLQVNINAVIHLTHLFLPGMLARQNGKIINHSSVMAVMHFPSSSTYCASKAAVLAFTNCLRQELVGTKVNTLVLLTPGVKTRMFDDIERKNSKHFEIPTRSIPAAQYAEMVRDAILNDLDELNPSGITGIGMKLAKYLPQVMEYAVSKRFRR